MAGKANGREKKGAAPGSAAPSSKLEAVRRAVSRLGKTARPAQLQGFVKEQFGIEMNADQVANYKGKILRKAAQPKPAAAREPKSPARAAGVGLSLGDIQKARELVRRIGAEQLRALIDLLAP